MNRGRVVIRPEKAGDEKLNHLIHEFRAVAERAYAARKKADPAYEETGSIRESYIVPVIGHSITTTVEGEGAVLSFIHSKGVIKDFHMHNEALQKLAHDILEMAQKKSPPV